MAEPFATVDDVRIMWRSMNAAEQEKCAYLLESVSDRLRIYAEGVGKVLDLLAADNEAYAAVLRSVTVDIAVRTMTANMENSELSQFSQSALGYTVSGTYANAGGGIYIKNAELKLLGLRRQRAGAMEYDFN